MSTTQSEELVSTEADEVLRWRFDELVRAGYRTEDAMRVAGRAEIDLHIATDLLRRGCPTQTALRIVL